MSTPKSSSRTGYRALVGLVAALAVVLAALMPASSASADPKGKAANSKAESPYFGAISLNLKDGKIGLANDKRSKRAALRSAVRTCKKKSEHKSACESTAWVKNGCGALALKKTKKGYRQGYAVAFDLPPAKKKAIRKAGKGSKVVAYVCTTRYH